MQSKVHDVLVLLAENPTLSYPEVMDVVGYQNAESTLQTVLSHARKILNVPTTGSTFKSMQAVREAAIQQGFANHVLNFMHPEFRKEEKCCHER